MSHLTTSAGCDGSVECGIQLDCLCDIGGRDFGVSTCLGGSAFNSRIFRLEQVSKLTVNLKTNTYGSLRLRCLSGAQFEDVALLRCL